MSLFERGDISNFFLDIYDDIEEDYSDFHEIMVEAIADIEDFGYLDDIDYPYEPLNLYNLYGVYEYQKTIKWIKNASSDSSLTTFSIFTNSQTNDGTLFVSNLKKKEVSVDDPLFIPSKLNLELTLKCYLMFQLKILNLIWFRIFLFQI